MNHKIRNFVWIISGIVLMAFMAMAATTISDDSISTTGFSQQENTNSSLRFVLRNINAGTNATTIISALNDVGHSMAIGIGSSNFVAGLISYPNATILFSKSRGDTLFANFHAERFIWLINLGGDGSADNLTQVMRIDEAGEVLINSKLDIGVPGVAGGLDVGEGGSYTTNSTGTTIVQAFSYDQSAVSGSKFTELTLDASNTLLASAGDRIYFGSTLKFWAGRFEISTASSGEVMEIFYYNGTNMTGSHYMGILKDNATSIGDDIFQQTSEKEYVTWDHEINEDWATADNIVDLIPDGASNMYWVALQVPPSGFATAPVITEIKVRGTDFDIVSGASYPVFWGQARVERHSPIALTVAKVPGGVTTVAIDIDVATQQTVFDFDSQGDNLAFFWTLPEAIDTSSDLHITLDYAADAIDTYELNLTVSRLTNSTLIGSSILPDFQFSNSITPDAANTIYNTVTIGDEISIQNMSIDDQLSFGLERADATNSLYPISITIHYIAFSTGDHV